MSDVVRTEEERLDRYCELVGDAVRGQPAEMVKELDAMRSLLMERAEAWQVDDPGTALLGVMVADLATILALYVELKARLENETP